MARLAVRCRLRSAPACEEAVSDRLRPNPPSFALNLGSPCRIHCLNCQVIYLFSWASRQPAVKNAQLIYFHQFIGSTFFAPLFSISHWEVSSFLSFFFQCPFVFIDLLGAILPGPSRLGSAPLAELQGEVGEPPQPAQAGVLHPP